MPRGARNKDLFEKAAELRRLGFGCRIIGRKLSVNPATISIWVKAMPVPARMLNLVPLEQMLIEHCPYSRPTIKRRLVALGLLKLECAMCGIGPVWNAKPLVLRLDHVNGVNDDCRRENLRLLCPNCDSQTETYCGRNAARLKRPAGIGPASPDLESVALPMSYGRIGEGLALTPAQS